MFIWVAIDVDKQLLNQKEEVKKIEKEIGFEESNISLLPLHISLKISSNVSEQIVDKVKKDIDTLFSSTNPFEIDIEGIELHDNIVWIRMIPNEHLTKLHDDLCSIFSEKYNLELQEFDNNFIYHSTLFLDSNRDKINKAYNLIQDLELPSKLVASKFIIGSSQEGKIGSYKVDKIVEKSTD